MNRKIVEDPLQTLSSSVADRIYQVQDAIAKNPSGYEDYMEAFGQYRQARVAFEEDFPQARDRLDNLTSLLTMYDFHVATEAYLQGVIDCAELMERFLPRTKYGRTDKTEVQNS